MVKFCLSASEKKGQMKGLKGRHMTAQGNALGMVP